MTNALAHHAPFDYSALEPALASEARATAERIRTRLQASYIDTGRDLLAIKDQLGHGHFGNWLKVEFQMTERSAENYMNATRFMEGRSETLSVLPANVIYALAAPSAPADLVAEVTAAAEAGTLPPANEIKERLSAAADEARKARIEARKPPEQVAKEKRSRESAAEKRKRLDAEYAEEKRRAEEAAVEAARLLLDRLADDELRKLSDLLGVAGWWMVRDRLKAESAAEAGR